ncbi:endonuclease domain-containing protein [Sphingomonas sp. LY29]|uniref:endonuclease domain-containing protein n=1 Tax=Sphingomonas sp. LY29 TaxID=3095341 RepID=UPI002D79BAD7|nr:endonuclease domain-containing protein [Sphingomonas sp. LY29]WRP26069.1 endonuclease domain-containing protein [Sphingomonas sp. LY29]
MIDKAHDRSQTLRSRILRNLPTPAEAMLWRSLRNRQVEGVRFNRQVPIGPFICDFVSRSGKLIIEVDGGQHAINLATDNARTHFLQTKGYRVLRFWNNEVADNIEGVLQVIVQALKNSPSPTPPASGRGF